MRIAICAHNIVKKGDGQGRANYEFVNYLINKGYEVHLYAHRVEAELIDKVVFYPIKVIDKPVILKVAMFLVIATIKLRKSCSARKRDKYDIIYADSGTYLGYSHIMCSHFCHKSYLNYKGCDLKMRLYDRVYETFNSLVERLEYGTSRLPRHGGGYGGDRKRATIIVVSEHLKQDLMSEYNIPSNRIKVVYNGVDLLEIQNPKSKIQNPKSTTLLFVGDLSYRKGLDFLIEAMKGIGNESSSSRGSRSRILRTPPKAEVFDPEAHQPLADKGGSRQIPSGFLTEGVSPLPLNVKLLIAGKIRNRYKKLAERLSNVEFLGFRTDIDKLLQEVDGFILPSLYDPFPVAVLEAMAIGLPIIISSNVGVSEIIQDMENGLIIKDPTNVNEIREKIQLFASHPEQMKEIGTNAYLTVKQIPWSKTVADKEKLIMELLVK